MAQQLEYDAKVDPTVSAHEELEALIKTLHVSGTLRVLNGFFGRFADISEVAMDEITKPESQRALANAALLFMAFAEIDPEDLQALLEGMERGAEEARGALQDDPPSTLKLLRLLHDPETRRGLYAGLTLVRSLGGSVPEELEDHS